MTDGDGDGATTIAAGAPTTFREGDAGPVAGAVVVVVGVAAAAVGVGVAAVVVVNYGDGGDGGNRRRRTDDRRLSTTRIRKPVEVQRHCTRRRS